MAREQTPEWDAIQAAAAILDGDATLLRADDSDIESLVRDTARAPIRHDSADEGARWAEDGWWLIPLAALLYLARFRREETLDPGEEATA